MRFGPNNKELIICFYEKLIYIIDTWVKSNILCCFKLELLGPILPVWVGGFAGGAGDWVLTKS